MTEVAFDSALLFAWLEARSVGRSLPAPVPDHGGLRVDTGSVVELCRWMFHRPEPGLTRLGRAIGDPGYLLKLCGPPGALRAALPGHWTLQPTHYLMTAGGREDMPGLPEGYALEVERTGCTTRMRVMSRDGEEAAIGYATETPRAFVYDRIVTSPEHRRKGLGRSVMTGLGRVRRNEVPELLVATEEGRALYARLGWRILSLVSTACVPIA